MPDVSAPQDLVPDYFPRTVREKHHLSFEACVSDTSSDVTSAEIEWIPNHARFTQRSKLSSHKPYSGHLLPDAWPKAVQGPLAWTGNELHDEEFIYELSEGDRHEIEHATRAFKETGLELEHISKETFRLPRFGATLERLCVNVHQGRGFIVLRGLDPSSYSREENVILYLGISSYIAEQRGRQSLDGRKITHITDLARAGIPVWQRRPIYSNLAQPFHADVICHVLALYFLSAAENGGETYLAPSFSVYNELAATRPDIIHTLAQNDWVHDTFGLNPPFYRRALLHYVEQYPILNFSRRIITGAPMTPRNPKIPPVTEAQAEALDAVHFCAQKHAIKLPLRAGDMCFVNNFAIMHSRASFKDEPSTRSDHVDELPASLSRRYVLRLWLNNPLKGWKIPPGLQLAWDRIFTPLEEIEDYYDIDPFNDPVKVRDFAGPKPGGGGKGGGGGGGSGGGVSTDCG